uniref:Uncharacterized protein n=1 Tax=Cyprinodon variegatus TaxID=28743 RepID=A0A3Q2EEC2_CYPVA
MNPAHPIEAVPLRDRKYGWNTRQNDGPKIIQHTSLNIPSEPQKDHLILGCFGFHLNSGSNENQMVLCFVLPYCPLVCVFLSPWLPRCLLSHLLIVCSLALPLSLSAIYALPLLSLFVGSLSLLSSHAVVYGFCLSLGPCVLFPQVSP